MSARVTNLETKRDITTTVEISPNLYYDLSFSSGDTTASDALVYPLPRQDKLPGLPALPESWSCTPHISSDDINSHVRPLISRGWRIIPASESPETGVSLAMTSVYQFSKYKTAREFLNLLCDMSSEEKHHAKITLDHKIVSVQFQTHTAHAAGVDSMGNRVVYKIPGLTARDIRWAIRCERVRAEMDDATVVQESLEELADAQRQSMKYLLWRYGGRTELISSRQS